MNILPILNNTPHTAPHTPAAIMHSGGPTFPTERNDGSPIRVGDYFIDNRYIVHVATATAYDDCAPYTTWQRGTQNDTRKAIKLLTARGLHYIALKVDTENKGPF